MNTREGALVAYYDFNIINTIDDFYISSKTALRLPNDFGNNLDALWDALTGFVPMPTDVVFANMTHEKRELFKDIIEVFKEAYAYLNGELQFYITNATVSQASALGDESDD